MNQDHQSESTTRKPGQLLTSKEVADLLCISVRDVRALCRAGEIRFVRVTQRKRRFRQEHLEEYVNRKPTPPRATAVDKSPCRPARAAAKTDKASLVKEMAAWD